VAIKGQKHRPSCSVKKGDSAVHSLTQGRRNGGALPWDCPLTFKGGATGPQMPFT